MKVGLLKTSPPGERGLSGVSRYLADLAPRLRERDVETAFFWTLGEGAGTPAVPYRRHLHGWGAYRAITFPNPRLTASIADWIRVERPDLLHVHWDFRQAIAALRDLPAGSPPVLVSFHTFEPVCPLKTHITVRGVPCDAVQGAVCMRRGCRSLQKRLMHDIPAQALTRRVSHRAAGYVAHNRELAELAERSGLEPMHMIPLGVDIDLFPAGAYPRPPVLLYAGRIRPEKGMAVLAEALPLILDAAPEARIHIAGDGPMKEALRRAVPAAHADRVQFLGTIPVPDLAREYATARAVLVPSVWKENFALVGPEAMAAATPVVASDLGGIREWLRHEENGLAVPPGDARALADASLRLLRDAELAARLGVEARRSAESMSMARHAEALATLYRSCLPRS